MCVCRHMTLWLCKVVRLLGSKVFKGGGGLSFSRGGDVPIAYFYVVRVFSDVLVAFLYFDICHNLQSHLVIENPEFSQPVVAGHFQ